MKVWLKLFAIIAALIVAITLASNLFRSADDEPQPRPPIASEAASDQARTSESQVSGTDADTVLVTRVIDGDTIELETGQTLRYIGINTPETKHPRKPVEYMGQEAAARNKELVEDKRVRLEKDVSETDRYGRLLRYVYVGDTMINEQLVLEGYAQAATFPPDVKYQERFREAERQARENKVGLWGERPTHSLSPTDGPRPHCSADVYNCDDFATCAEVLGVFEGCPSDVHGLDGDDDGVPCEALCG